MKRFACTRCGSIEWLTDGFEPEVPGALKCRQFMDGGGMCRGDYKALGQPRKKQSMKPRARAEVAPARPPRTDPEALDVLSRDVILVGVTEMRRGARFEDGRCTAVLEFGSENARAEFAAMLAGLGVKIKAR